MDTYFELWPWIVMLAAAGLFFAGLAAMFYVAYRFLALAISLDSAILMGMNRDTLAKSSPQQRFSHPIQPPTPQPATEGDFLPYDEEERFISEQVNELRRKGTPMTEEELDSFIRQAVTDSGGESKTNG